MITDNISIRPINPGEWLPDRCLIGLEPFDPKTNIPEPGCPAINYAQTGNRQTLEKIYKLTINKYGGCGFVAWANEKIIGYHNFFPFEIMKEFNFYGRGFGCREGDRILIHNCLTIVKSDHLRKGIASRLVSASINWAAENKWLRFEVHMVLPDCEKGWKNDQKSCLSFWEKFGFKIFKEYDADEATKQFYGVTKRYSVYLSLDRNE